MENVGHNIRAIRKAQGLTLQQVALAANYDVGNLSKIERGVIEWSSQALHAIAAALGVPLRDFFLSEEERKSLRAWASMGISERAVLTRMLPSPGLAANTGYTKIELTRSAVSNGAPVGVPPSWLRSQYTPRTEE